MEIVYSNPGSKIKPCIRRRQLNFLEIMYSNPVSKIKHCIWRRQLNFLLYGPDPNFRQIKIIIIPYVWCVRDLVPNA